MTNFKPGDVVVVYDSDLERDVVAVLDLMRLDGRWWMSHLNPFDAADAENFAPLSAEPEDIRLATEEDMTLLSWARVNYVRQALYWLETEEEFEEVTALVERLLEEKVF